MRDSIIFYNREHIFLPITKFVISSAKIRDDVNCGAQVNQFLACLKPVYDMKRIIINC